MRTACIDEELTNAARHTAEAIKHAKLTVVTAESCTAGLVSAALSHADEASRLLHGSFVVYTKINKMLALGIDKQLLIARGAVCEEVATQMALGALERSPATLALAITGVLGPDPDEDGNPVGLVYVSVCARDGTVSTKEFFYDRQEPDVLRHRVTLDALDFLRAAAKRKQ
jgi:nicotinamide-nucleotide amidase